MPKRQTKEEFISKAEIANNYKYDYSLVEYINNNVKVKVICKNHGIFLSRPADHTNGHGCPYCGGSKLMNKDEFISKAVKVHGDIYDYSDVDYKGNKTKVEIKCKEHGAFLQVPNSHLFGRGCPKCFGNTKLDTEEFVRRAVKTHGDRYDYSLVNYSNISSNVKVICKVHGEFEIVANNHIAGANCPVCVKQATSNRYRQSLPELLERSFSTHGDKYKYHHTKPVLGDDTIGIVCPTHGEFKQKVEYHIKGHGCPDCGREAGGWTRTKIKNLVDRKGSGILYIIRLSNDGESFLKIGITTRAVKHRLYDFPYEISILHEECYTDGAALFDIEKHLHRVLKKHKYKPHIRFGGETECFEDDLNIESIKDEILKFNIDRSNLNK